ncbi:hypothetical protein MRX96_017126 [Rhipicephalus microplus]
MATFAPHHVIYEDLGATRSRDQRDREDAKPSQLSPTDGPLTESLSPSPPYVRVHDLVALPPPRNTVSRGDYQGQHHPDGATEGMQLQDERLCIVFWVVGAALIFPAILSAWLVLVPFFVHGNWTTPRSLSFTSKHTPSAAASRLFTTMTVPLTSTYPWTNVPTTCIAPVTWSTLPPRLNVSAPYSFGPSNESSKPVFCLYNNTRVNAWRYITNSSWNYVFASLPFALCPYVVYWSVGIENGNLTSRQPDFDENYGLYQLRAIVDSLNFNTVKILVALGGYPEDAPHFSRLGRDFYTMERLMGNVAGSLKRFGLSGVAVHWVEARDGCHGPDDVTVLKTLLHTFRTWFNRRMMSDVMITVILGLTKASQLVAQEAADVVDHFFLATEHEGRITQKAFYETCEGRTTAIHNAYRLFASALPPKKLRRSQLCLSDSLFASVVRGRLVSGTFMYSFDDVSAAPIHWECRWRNACQIPFFGAPCISYFVRTVSMDNIPDRIIVIDNASEVYKRLDFTKD